MGDAFPMFRTTPPLGWGKAWAVKGWVDNAPLSSGNPPTGRGTTAQNKDPELSQLGATALTTRRKNMFMFVEFV